MINMLHNGNYFEIKDYEACLRTWGDTLDSFNSLFYKYNIANFENKPDSAAFYLEDLLTRGEFGADTFDFYFRLWSLYAKTLHNYKKALLTCDKVEIYLKENPHNMPQEALLEWNEYVSGWKKQTRQWGTEPAIKIVRDNINDTHVAFRIMLGGRCRDNLYILYMPGRDLLQSLCTREDTRLTIYVNQKAAASTKSNIAFRVYPYGRRIL